MRNDIENRERKLETTEITFIRRLRKEIILNFSPPLVIYLYCYLQGETMYEVIAFSVLLFFVIFLFKIKRYLIYIISVTQNGEDIVIEYLTLNKRKVLKIFSNEIKFVKDYEITKGRLPKLMIFRGEKKLLTQFSIFFWKDNIDLLFSFLNDDNKGVDLTKNYN